MSGDSSDSRSATTVSKSRWTAFVQSPYLFALLVGLHPPLFQISNNWFSREPTAIAAFAAVVALSTLSGLGALFVIARHLLGVRFPRSAGRDARRLLVLAGTCMWGFLLRRTFLEVLDERVGLLVGIGLLIGGLLAWLSDRFRLLPLNVAMILLCVTSAASTVVSVASTESREMHDHLDPALSREETDRWVFRETPNIYYIVPDGYPSREALDKIFGMHNEDFYRQLESWGFRVTHSAHSNYVSTLSSVASTFGMGHHYYRMSIGNHENLGGRKLITGYRNPLMWTLRHNGYRIHLIHQTDYLLTMGCYADECSPSLRWDAATKMLLPYRVRDRLGLMAEQSDEEFERRLRRHLERTATAREPQFSYFHLRSPSHSDARKLTDERLAVFREEFVPKVRSANALMGRLIPAILDRDPNALVIVDADHGGFGRGWGARNRNRLRGAPRYEMVLDHLGVLLAIRWPGAPPAFLAEPRTNVNLFRHVIAFLCHDETIAAADVPDDGYLWIDGSVRRVMRAGKILSDFQDPPTPR